MLFGKKTALLSGVAVALAAGLWFFTQGTPAQAPESITPANAQETATADSAALATLQIDDMTLGAADAPITVIEYASYTCPHCATFHNTVFKDLKKDYIDTGKVKFVYREVYFDRYGLWAAIIARCAGEARYFGVQERLYTTLKDWTSEDPAAAINNLKKIGLSVGLAQEELESCLKDEATAEAMIAKFEANMKEHDVKGTPTLIINGKLHQNTSYAELKTILDAALN